MDGVDVALIDTDGERISRFGPSALHPYREDEIALLRRAVEEARSLTDREARPGVLGDAERLVTALHAGAVRVFLDVNGIDPASIDVIGFHGQTVLHRPDEKLTVQIGDGQLLADEAGIRVVYDLRAADVAAGGQGAPLVPVFHQAMANDLAREHPIAVLNIGGVANVTFVDGGDPVACDTGPGNAMIDDFMRARTGAPYDNHGDVAATGTPDQAFIDRVLADTFFGLRPPKSLDRNAFAFANIGLPDHSVADGAATLSALTVQAVGRVIAHLPQPPKAWIVAGGGARNATLVNMLRERLAPATVETADDVGWSADALEAQAFAFLAARTLRGLPITFPKTTGAPAPMRGGIIVRP